MPLPYYTLKTVTTRGAGVAFTAEFYASDGTLHWPDVSYEFTPASEWTPEAAAALGAATDDAGRLAAVRLDCERLLRELEDPAHPAGTRAARALEF